MMERIEAEMGRIASASHAAFGATVLTHPDLCGLHAMWNELRGPRAVPFRAELDAGKIGARAPFLAILEYVGPSNFRIRIAGDRLNKWFGLELRGMSALSMVAAPFRNHMQAAMNRVTGEPAVAALHGAAVSETGFSAPFEMALLPMRSDFGKVDRVLVGMWLLDGRVHVPAPVRLSPETITLAAVDEAEAALDEAIDAATPADAPDGEVAPDEAESERAEAEAARAAEARRAAAEPMVKAPGRRGHLRLVKGD